MYSCESIQTDHDKAIGQSFGKGGWSTGGLRVVTILQEDQEACPSITVSSKVSNGSGDEGSGIGM